MLPYLINIYIHMYIGKWGLISSGSTAMCCCESTTKQTGQTVYHQNKMGNDLDLIKWCSLIYVFSYYMEKTPDFTPSIHDMYLYMLYIYKVIWLSLY